MALTRSEINRRWLERPGNRERNRERCHDRHVRDLEKSRTSSREAMRRQRADRPQDYWFTTIKKRAEKRGLEFDLTREFLEELFQQTHCCKTGIEFDREVSKVGRRNPWAPSVDRKDSHLGYVQGNVQLVCWAYNAAKMEWDDDVVLKLAKALVGRHG